jgi:hypothetical protein
MSDEPDNYDPHKGVPPNTKIITWDAALTIMANQLSIEIAENPFEWMKQFTDEVIMIEARRRGFSIFKQRGTDNEHQN